MYKTKQKKTMKIVVVYLVSVTWTLIMIGKWNNRSANAENHCRMNFTMCISGTVCHFFVLMQVVDIHRNHSCFFFQSINILYHATRNQILPPGREKNKIGNLQRNGHIQRKIEIYYVLHARIILTREFRKMLM